ncbi:MAG: hypothetical protein H3C30_13105 [Candidatus Hydrogenedentes bacterium]|nr:hypothetical protein [Candidatus Hydrogenedentota bacterium]
MRGMSRGIGILILAVCMAGGGFSQSAGGEIVSGTAEPHEPDLGVTIRCDAPGLKAGDKIPITFAVENLGGNVYNYLDRSYDRSGRIREYELRVVDADMNPVPDPYATKGAIIGGGLCNRSQLARGESFTKTIALNRWALVTKPGTYHVTGIYHSDTGSKLFTTPPIAVEILPRNDAEMAAHVADLSEKLALSQDGEARLDLAERLVYTCDPRAVPAIIELYYDPGNARFWAGVGIHYYIPPGQEVTDALIGAATKRGLDGGILTAIERVGTPEQTIKSLISISLAPEHPAAWAEGAWGAQNYPDDAFTPRLIEIAMNSNSGSPTRDPDTLTARWSAISPDISP